ncbi:sulfite exporter TauE/SafE family protein [Yoonia sediminilitoris]|uniref:Probable membrane transporter protein n=1 Tax=Yoonia sediminilitoris TaxID=1286148 RepID=A0A2T6KDK8_9RHOB|nr:sulfite exporter TauE/SafE family protein [Yoonia sediminilitoris]PUB13083.1 putative membrane protein YfcA [Yoonia sediminilitoris]RCW94420.1 putative membrane protein YfcA [Yoonia sediminilitoris]
MITGFSIAALLGLIGGLLITGAIAGLLAGLLGVGGGIVIVPVLIIVAELFNIPQEVAMLTVVATSLATIIPTSISSAVAHNKRGAIDRDILRGWIPAIFVGALLGGIASKTLGSDGLTLVFGSVALLVAVNLALAKPIVLTDQPPATRIGQSAIALPMGFISALMGIGGGTLAVPVMTMMSVTVHRAIATASVFGLAIAVPAVCGFIWNGLGVEGRPPASLGFVNLPATVILFSVSVLTAPIGAKLAHGLSARPLKLAFAAFLAISGARMLWKFFA